MIGEDGGGASVEVSTAATGFDSRPSNGAPGPATARSDHQLQMKTCGVPGVEWNWQATCTCGWAGHNGTKKSNARREWRAHQKEVCA